MLRSDRLLLLDETNHGVCTGLLLDTHRTPKGQETARVAAHVADVTTLEAWCVQPGSSGGLYDAIGSTCIAHAHVVVAGISCVS